MSDNVGVPFVVLNCDHYLELIENFVNAIDKIAKFSIRQVQALHLVNVVNKIKFHRLYPTIRRSPSTLTPTLCRCYTREMV